MAQAKKKQATKTAKKQPRSAKAARCSHGSKSTRKAQCSNRERNHIYIVTILGMIAAILLCANAAILSA